MKYSLLLLDELVAENPGAKYLINQDEPLQCLIEILYGEVYIYNTIQIL